jgi:hypothetical protein
MSKERCASCKWMSDDWGTCFNGDSPNCADEVDDDCWCREWEPRKEEPQAAKT